LACVTERVRVRERKRGGHGVIRQCRQARVSCGALVCVVFLASPHPHPHRARASCPLLNVTEFGYAKVRSAALSGAWCVGADATTAASGGPLLFAQSPLFAIPKPKNRKANGPSCSAHLRYFPGFSPDCSGYVGQCPKPNQPITSMRASGRLFAAGSARCN
jgi:hypothetical protein